MSSGSERSSDSKQTLFSPGCQRWPRRALLLPGLGQHDLAPKPNHSKLVMTDHRARVQAHWHQCPIRRSHVAPTQKEKL
jgi:hypothetical protein